MPALIALVAAFILIFGRASGNGRPVKEEDKPGSEVVDSFFYSTKYVSIEKGEFAEEATDLTLMCGDVRTKA